jgi:hypothetical protein
MRCPCLRPHIAPPQTKTNKRYAGNVGYTVSETAEKVKADVGTIDILVHSLANGPEVQKPLLETSRKGYLAALSASSYSMVSMLQVRSAVLGVLAWGGGGEGGKQEGARHGMERERRGLSGWRKEPSSGAAVGRVMLAGRCLPVGLWARGLGAASDRMGRRLGTSLESAMHVLWGS